MPGVKITTAVGIVVAAVIALGIGIGVTYLNLTSTTSSGASQANTTSYTKPTISPPSSNTVTVKANSSFPCSTFYKVGAARGTVFSINPVISTLVLCVKFYYFDQYNAQVFQSASQLLIQGKSPSASGFNATSQPAIFSIGGPTNESEGIIVVYQISSMNRSNGAWLLNFGWLTDNATGSPEFMNCDTEYGLMLGNGQPSYYPADDMCMGYPSATTFPNDHLFAEVIGSGILGS